VRGALLVDAVTFVVSAALLAYLPSLPPAPAEEADRVSLLTDAKAGLRYIWSVPIGRIIGLGSFAVVTLNGIDDVALVFLAKDSLGGGDPAASVLYAAVGVGLLVGYALLARYAGGVSTVFLLLLGFGLSSAGNLLSGLAWAVAAAFVMQTIRGVGISAMDVATNTTPLSSVWCPQLCWAGSSATCRARSASPPGCPTCSVGCFSISLRRARPSSSPAREVCLPPSLPPWYFGAR
jgi:Na+/melibiose symporter-like transporter